MVYLFFSLRAVCSPLGRIYNIATNVSFVSCSFLRCFRCSFPCVFSLVYIVIVFVRCFICSFNCTVLFRSALKIALELVSISRQWQLHSYYSAFLPSLSQIGDLSIIATSDSAPFFFEHDLSNEQFRVMITIKACK